MVPWVFAKVPVLLTDVVVAVPRLCTHPGQGGHGGSDAGNEQRPAAASSAATPGPAGRDSAGATAGPAAVVPAALMAVLAAPTGPAGSAGAFPRAARAAIGGLLAAAGVAAQRRAALPAGPASAALRPLRGTPRVAAPPGHGRRQGVLQVASASLAVPSAAVPAWAEQSTRFKAEWAADEAVSFFNTFSEDSYGAMRDDTRRTPQFIKAIQQRVSARKGCTVLDIGTGPFALFALVAARAGAKKVYAVEANPEAVKRAQDFVNQAEDIPEGAIEVIEGLTTAIKLPEKVDIVCAEIIGAIASEENCCATIKDAQNRHMKDPTDPFNFIPVGVETYMAPVSYALHGMLAPPRFERLQGRPLRVNCRDETVQLLADPQRLESLQFADPALPGRGRIPETAFSFPVTSERLQANYKKYYDAVVKDGAKADEAERLATSVAYGFSGVAFWPKLILDTTGDIVVESRGPRGEHQKSHWQTLLSLTTPVPAAVKARGCREEAGLRRGASRLSFLAGSAVLRRAAAPGPMTSGGPALRRRSCAVQRQARWAAMSANLASALHDARNKEKADINIQNASSGSQEGDEGGADKRMRDERASGSERHQVTGQHEQEKQFPCLPSGMDRKQTPDVLDATRYFLDGEILSACPSVTLSACPALHCGDCACPEDASAFECCVVRGAAQQLAAHFGAPVSGAAVLRVCDSVMGAGWAGSLAKSVSPEQPAAAVFEFVASCGAHLDGFSAEELRRDLWPLFLALGPLRARSCLRALSADEVRLYLVPLHRALSAGDFLELASVEDVREEIADLEALIQNFALHPRHRAGNPFQFMTGSERGSVSERERADLCLLYVRLRHSQDVCRHFGVSTVDAEMLRRLFAVLAERDVRALAAGRAPAKAVLARYEARRRTQEYRCQSGSHGRGPLLARCDCGA
ncbi:unnamed protein product [Prorocentrum cordatum]|uniref:Uncharacterized protein n=1 Tax=Prorocentrum cordatum TaxID=2364126 RepID=A0ABN9QAG4_9DINO|nr:unnamed protein product [Polarella glacialis]